MSIGDITIRYEERQNNCYVFLSGTYRTQDQLDKTIKQLEIVSELMNDATKQIDNDAAKRACESLKEAGY